MFTNINVPKDTWVEISDTDTKFQVKVFGTVFQVYATESTTVPTVTPAVGDNVSILEPLEWYEFTYTDSNKLYVYSKGTNIDLVKGL